jgi:hypothetical protein
MIQAYLTLTEAIDAMQPHQRIIKGSRDNVFHLIDENDRDFKFAMTKETALKAIEEITIYNLEIN